MLIVLYVVTRCVQSKAIWDDMWPCSNITVLCLLAASKVCSVHVGSVALVDVCFIGSIALCFVVFLISRLAIATKHKPSSLTIPNKLTGKGIDSSKTIFIIFIPFKKTLYLEHLVFLLF